MPKSLLGTHYIIFIHGKESNNKQAGAELGQAQLKLGFDFTSISVELVW